jgi:predicted nucleic-acid-binding Zn-ribbon protein
MDKDDHRAPKPGAISLKFTCVKCGHNEYEVQDMSTTSGMMSRMVNLQNRRFSAVSCLRCSYTELYKTSSGALRNVFDVLIGS